jgi:hypothetical protein
MDRKALTGAAEMADAPERAMMRSRENIVE